MAAVGHIRKGIEGGERAGGRHFVEGAQARRTSGEGGAVEISRLVPHQAAVGSGAICAAGEGLQDGFDTRGVEREDGSITGSAAVGSGAVVVAGPVRGEACDRELAIGFASEAVEGGLLAVWVDFI